MRTITCDRCGATEDTSGVTLPTITRYVFMPNGHAEGDVADLCLDCAEKVVKKMHEKEPKAPPV